MMASNVYTLPELVDLALKTPEIGAVNFNILRKLLHKILVECKLQNVTDEWKPVSLPSSAYIEEDEEFPDHPLFKKIIEEKERSSVSATPKEEDKVESEEEVPSESVDEDIQKTEKPLRRDTAVLVKIPEPQTVLAELVETDESQTPQEAQLKEPPEEKKIEVQTTRKATPEKKKKEVQTTRKATPEKKKKEVQRTRKAKTEKYEPKTSPLVETWRTTWDWNKLSKRIEAIEDELNSIVRKVDNLWSWKEAKSKRFQQLEGEIESGYFGATIGREEFEDTVEELGEIMTLLRTKQKEQKDIFDAVNQDIVKEMEHMATQEEMNQSKEELNKKLNTLSKAIKTMQEIIKETIYPEACGTSKCLCCKRNAHLPLSGMVVDPEKKVSVISTESGMIMDPKKKADGDSPKSTIKRLNGKRRSNSPQELTFTTACLRRLIGEDGMRKMLDEKPSEDLALDEKDNLSEKSIITTHLLNVETFEVSNLTEDFAPLRHDCIYVPSIRPKKAPATIPVGRIKV